MTKEDKNLLLKDLCGRLPYGVICNVQDGKINKDYVLTDIHANGYGFDNKYGVFYGSESFVVKPYLRPLSSMTEEERSNIRMYCMTQEGIIYNVGVVGAFNSPAIIDFLNTHHFDYRGLIEKGLALEATEGVYKTE